MTTEKRAVPESVISQVKAVKLKRRSFMSLTRDLFLFSFYTRGMPFVDMAFLRKSQINDGVLTYDRHKTGQRVTVHLEPCMLEVISRYHNDDSTYVFPLLKSENPQKAYDEYLYKLNQYNHSLKRLAKIAGVKDRLTSYTPRHTWASVAYDSNVDLPVISKALGHSNTQTTLTYIKEINDSRLDDANRMIVSKIEAME
jgi:integrase